MKQKSYRITEEDIDKIISAAYGAGKKTENYVARLIAENVEARELYERYKKTAEAVRAVKMPEVPASLEKLVENLTEPKPPVRSFYTAVGSFLKEPLAVSAFAAVIVVIVLMSILTSPKRRHSEFTTEELLRANREVLASLGFVGRVLKETENTLTKEILYKEIGKPISESVKTIDKLLSNGGKNEK